MSKKDRVALYPKNETSIKLYAYFKNIHKGVEIMNKPKSGYDVIVVCADEGFGEGCGEGFGEGCGDGFGAKRLQPAGERRIRGLVMSFYMHPETARRLLAMSRAYRDFRWCGWDRKAAQELARIHVGVKP